MSSLRCLVAYMTDTNLAMILQSDADLCLTISIMIGDTVSDGLRFDGLNTASHPFADAHRTTVGSGLPMRDFGHLRED